MASLQIVLINTFYNPKNAASIIYEYIYLIICFVIVFYARKQIEEFKLVKFKIQNIVAKLISHKIFLISCTSCAGAA